MRISDWSSDVCSSDLIGTGIEADGFLERVRIAYAANFSLNAKTDHGRFDFDPVLFSRNVSESAEGDLVDEEEASLLDRKSVEKGKRVSVRVDIGGIRTMKKTQNRKRYKQIEE